MLGHVQGRSNISLVTKALDQCGTSSRMSHKQQGKHIPRMEPTHTYLVEESDLWAQRFLLLLHGHLEHSLQLSHNLRFLLLLCLSPRGKGTHHTEAATLFHQCRLLTKHMSPASRPSSRVLSSAGQERRAVHDRTVRYGSRHEYHLHVSRGYDEEVFLQHVHVLLHCAPQVLGLKEHAQELGRVQLLLPRLLRHAALVPATPGPTALAPLPATPPSPKACITTGTQKINLLYEGESTLCSKMEGQG